MKINVLENGVAVTRDMTPEEETSYLANIPQITTQERIAELKQLLSDSDYKAIKYAEGWFTDEEYAETKAQRQDWRDQINELEEDLA